MNSLLSPNNRNSRSKNSLVRLSPFNRQCKCVFWFWYRHEQQDQIALLPQLQTELDAKDSDLMSLRSNLSVLESRYGDAKAKLESLEEQNRKNQEELEAKLAKASETKKETETAEMNALREANENLKVLLSGAEKKYMRISGLNLELQKKVDNLEQKNRMSMDQVYDMRWDLIVDLWICVKWTEVHYVKSSLRMNQKKNYPWLEMWEWGVILRSSKKNPWMWKLGECTIDYDVVSWGFPRMYRNLWDSTSLWFMFFCLSSFWNRLFLWLLGSARVCFTHID